MSNHEEHESQAAAQRKYLELQVLNQKMQQVQEQMEALEQQAVDVERVSGHLEELSKVSNGTEALVPVANGLFAKAKLLDTQNLIVNVGSNVSVQKSVPEVKQLILAQVEEMRKLQDDLAKQLQQLTSHAEQAEAELRKLVE
jgi:prefoldin alpha subunit